MSFNPGNFKASSEEITLICRILDLERCKYIDILTGKQVKKRGTYNDEDLMISSESKEKLQDIVDKIYELRRNNIDLTDLELRDSLKRHRKILKKEELSSGDEEELSSNRRKKISKNIREVIWLRDYGNVFTTMCFCCKRNIITPYSAECGHIIAHANGGKEEADNLIMICSKCNKDMGTTSITDYMVSKKYV